MARLPMLLGWVRITASNGAVRTTEGGTTQTRTITPGVYWIGLNGDTGGGDESAFGSKSLLEAFADQSQLSLILEYPGQGSIVSPGKTGHIWANGPSGTNSILWTHADTTVDPRWFGLRKNAGVYVDTTGITTSYADISDISSSLAFVSDINVRQDRARTAHIEIKTRADDGTRYRRRFGGENQRLLEFRTPGLPRFDENLRYHELRRFVDAIKLGGARDRFWFISDSSETSYVAQAWDPDDASEFRRYGRQDLTLMDEEESLSSEPDQTFEGYYQEWHKAFWCAEHVA